MIEKHRNKNVIISPTNRKDDWVEYLLSMIMALLTCLRNVCSPICTYVFNKCKIQPLECRKLPLNCRILPIGILSKKLHLFYEHVKLSLLMICKYCNDNCIKKGFYKTIQRYYCKICKRYQQKTYTYTRYVAELFDKKIIFLNNNGNSISSISRTLIIPQTTVARKIREIAAKIEWPKIKERGQEYEVDEIRTFVGKKDPANRRYIIYGINKATRNVVSFYVGRRTKYDIGKVVNSVLKHNPIRIYTDDLPLYKYMINATIHKVRHGFTNYIERKNLTVRTHLKRLTRKTICFSRSVEMLQSCIAIYFRYGYKPISVTIN